MKINSDLGFLRNILYETLRREIGSMECCLLDLPNHYNMGDRLIWEGEKALFNNIGVKVKYASALQFFNPKMITPGDCILLHGGGNFGDLYPKHNNFREQIIKKYPNNKIIILPQTMHFSSTNNMKRNAEILSYHTNLVICARDNESLKLLRDNYTNKAILLPDTAFAIEQHTQKKTKSNGRVLYLHRTDKELKNEISKDSLSYIKNLNILDWPTYQNRHLNGILHIFTTKLNKVLFDTISAMGVRWSSKYDVYGFIKLASKESQYLDACNFLSNYDLVITTRLHGHILACLLGIPNIVLDNSYGKNKNLYNTWMKLNSLNAYYAESAKDIETIMKNQFSSLISK